jgi:hypothetical protein
MSATPAGSIVLIAMGLALAILSVALLREPANTAKWLARISGGRRGERIVRSDPVRVRERALALAFVAIVWLALGAVALLDDLL